MLQYIYSEAEESVDALVKEVAPQINEISKTQIMEAATIRAEEIADDIAKTEEITQDQHSAIMEACSQLIYTQTLAGLAKVQVMYSLQETYGQAWDETMHPHLTKQKREERYIIDHYNHQKSKKLPVSKELDSAYKSVTYGKTDPYERERIERKVDKHSRNKYLRKLAIGSIAGAGIGAAGGYGLAKTNKGENALAGATVGVLLGTYGAAGHHLLKHSRVKSKMKILQAEGKI